MSLNALLFATLSDQVGQNENNRKNIKGYK
jgi:hypothetical protein